MRMSMRSEDNEGNIHFTFCVDRQNDHSLEMAQGKMSLIILAYMKNNTERKMISSTAQ